MASLIRGPQRQKKFIQEKGVRGVSWIDLVLSSSDAGFHKPCISRKEVQPFITLNFMPKYL